MKLFSKSTLLILFIFAAALGSARAFDAGSFIKSAGKGDAPTSSIKTAAFDIDESAAANVFKSGERKIEISGFPVSPTETAKLTLELGKPVFDQKTQWLRGTKNGIIPAKAPEIISYKGKIAGEENSTVLVNYSKGAIYFMVMRGDGAVYSLAPQRSAPKSRNTLRHVIAPASADKEFNYIPVCGSDNHADGHNETDDMIELAKETKNRDYLMATELQEANIAVEGTYDFYKLLGSNYDRAAAYVASVISHSARIYEENVNITFYLPWVLIWEDEFDDPYYDTENLAEKLYKTRDVWSSRSSVDRAIGVVFASVYNQPPGTIVAGISFGGTPMKGSLCNYNRGYCVLGIHGDANYPTVDYTWDVNVACHEMGHNFGCPHTHNCYWYPNMIDTCITKTIPYNSDGCVETGQPIPRPGTIMSYCHTTNSTHSVQLKFHERMRPLISVAAGKANCINVPPSSIVRLLQPLGGAKLEAGKVAKIRWASARVNLVDLKLSTDGGASWSYIEKQIPATDSIYAWDLPMVNSDECLVMIEDSFDPEIFDMSLVHFDISSPSILIDDDEISGNEFGQKETILLRWDKNLVDKVRIEYSTDGGLSWIEIEGDFDKTLYNWDLPDIEKENIIIRVVDESNDEIIDQTGPFSIGKEYAKILSPNGGETFLGGTQATIRWESRYISDVYFEYSLDGEEWDKVKFGRIDASEGEYLWRVPKDVYSENVQLRIASFVDRETWIDYSDDVFKIDTIASGVEDVKSAANAFKITKVTPNPANENITITLEKNIATTEPARIFLTDETGAYLNLLTERELPLGVATRVEIDLPDDVSSGSYFLVVRCGETQAVSSVKIVK